MIQKAALIPEAPSTFDMDGATAVVPREGQMTLSLSHDESSQNVANTHNFSTGRFGYNVQRWVHLIPTN